MQQNTDTKDTACGEILAAKCINTGLYFDGTSFAEKDIRKAKQFPPGTTADSFRPMWSAAIEMVALSGHPLFVGKTDAEIWSLLRDDSKYALRKIAKRGPNKVLASATHASVGRVYAESQDTLCIEFGDYQLTIPMDKMASFLERAQDAYVRHQRKI